MFICLLLVLLFAKLFAAAACPTILNTTIEIDFIFSLNQTYAPVNTFPVSSASKMPQRSGTSASDFNGISPVYLTPKDRAERPFDLAFCLSHRESPRPLIPISS
jgi:hypothetical protein